MVGTVGQRRSFATMVRSGARPLDPHTASPRGLLEVPGWISAAPICTGQRS